ncbi:magnesium transporter CorA family protein [Candidatus Bathyarchaeota archaeon]|nr:magnesium transporter CorA family protein [Candidatus Bathyarchaeota archaeon]
MHLQIPSEKEVDYVIEKTGVLKEFINSTLNENERPRFDIEQDVLIIFRVPCEKMENSVISLETIPIGIIITSDYVITVSLMETDVLKDFYENKVKNFSTSKRIRFLMQILSRANYYFVKYLDKIEEEIDRTEVTLRKSMRNEDLIRLFNLQKTLIYFNRAILANGIVLDNIFKGRVVKLYEDDKDLLDDIIIENKQSLEMTTTNYNILNNTIAAYSSLVSNNLNVVMKLLTSLTIIMSIPMILAGLYGMNVRLPLQDNLSAFAFMLLISLFMSIVIPMVFIKKKYL